MNKMHGTIMRSSRLNHRSKIGSDLQRRGEGETVGLVSGRPVRPVCPLEVRLCKLQDKIFENSFDFQKLPDFFTRSYEEERGREEEDASWKYPPEVIIA
jgi:hypothetical protein